MVRKQFKDQLVNTAYRKFAVYSENYMKIVRAFCGQSEEFLVITMTVNIVTILTG
jgi:hypothetical protein